VGRHSPDPGWQVSIRYVAEADLITIYRIGLAHGRTVFTVDVERLHFFDPETGLALGG
jgi:hypothetical protein